MKQKLLFLCTGNYYRSRFAEEYFNHLAIEQGLRWEAHSKGLSQHMPNPENPGPISMHALQALHKRKVTGQYLTRYPEPVEENDFIYFEKIIALSESEHRPMIKERFNDYLGNISYFEIGDLPIEDPGKAMNKLAFHVDQLIKQFK